MERQELDEKVKEASKVIFSYCRSRTSSQFDAEDLAQDIVVEIYRSAANIRDDRAFYGFMWSVAGNVYRQWCRRRQLSREVSFTEGFPEDGLGQDSGAADAFEAVLGEDSDIMRLRRELALLSEKYRTAMILYYLEDKPCSRIADILSVSEGMVKYLLFKARKTVKDGMGMERNYGEQSYNPRKLGFCFWGDVNRYGDICGSRLVQNILFACYNDRLNAEQISLEIGVGLPYIEDELKKLCEYDLLRMDGRKYYSNLVIFTNEFQREAGRKTAHLKEGIAQKVRQAVLDREAAIRSLGFAGADMDGNTFRWQISCMLLWHAVINKFQESIALDYPVDVFGSHCFRWGVEKGSEKMPGSGEVEKGSEKMPDSGGVGKGSEKMPGSGESGGRVDDLKREIRWSFANSQADHERGYIKFMDFPVNGEAVHHYFFGDRVRINIFLDIAAGKTEHFSENDKAAVEEVVRKGYVAQRGGALAVNAPVFTEEQIGRLMEILEEPGEEIAAMCGELFGEVSKVLQNHVPAHLKKQARQMPYFALFGDAITAPVRSLYAEGFLTPVEDGCMLPTTFAVLKG